MVKTVSAFVIDDLTSEIVRDEKRHPKRLPDWKKTATDGMGRTHNPKLHGPEPELDAQGYLKVRRRDGPKPMTGSTIVDDVVALYRRPGYVPYLINAKPGRMEHMQAHDWEPVQSPEGVVRLKLPSKATGAEDMVLMEKPQEWYDEDQLAKTKLAVHNLDERSTPTDDPDGLMNVTAGSGLRKDRLSERLR